MTKEVFKESKDPMDYYKRMDELIDKNKGKVAAIGECGLDYDRLEYSDRDTQLK